VRFAQQAGQQIASGSASAAPAAAAPKSHWGWLKAVGAWLVKAKVWLLLVMKPLGAWGLLGLSMVDSAAIPMPFLDPLVVSYGVNDHTKAVLYCFMAAVGSSCGSLLPYFLGRAGGELILLKRINRERYERLRDRFERQEFLAIMLPAMCPPPMPVKLVELAAGVFEMRVLSYFLAICTGKFIRFGVETLITILYGPEIFHATMREMHRHSALLIVFVGIGLGALAIWVLRKVFDKRKGIPLPVEDEAGAEFEN
jgi:membrane protein YqaA with SNARE-associated domain